MFGIIKYFKSAIFSLLRQDAKFFRQYVGDDVVLMVMNDGVFIYLDGSDASLTPSILREGTWEPQVSNWLQTALRSGDCFVDIGGNNGIHALRAGRKVGETGKVIVFEPQDKLARLIERSACANLMVYNFHVRRLAIGADAGVIRLGKFAHLTGSATVTPNELIVEYVEVALATMPGALDQLTQELGETCQPDVIKIDVEGFEYAVWEGMKAWSRSRDRLAIILEYSPVSYRNSGCDSFDLLQEFSNYGFSVKRLFPDGVLKELSEQECKILAESSQQYDLVLTKGDF